MTNATDTAVAEVLAAEAARGQAIAENDWDALDKILADEYEYTHSTGHSQNKEQWLEGMHDRDRQVIRENLAVRVYGEVAVVRGSSVYRYAEPFAGDSHFGSTIDALQVWLRRDGRWQLLQSHNVKSDNQPSRD